MATSETLTQPSLLIHQPGKNGIVASRDLMTAPSQLILPRGNGREPAQNPFGEAIEQHIFTTQIAAAEMYRYLLTNDSGENPALPGIPNDPEAFKKALLTPQRQRVLYGIAQGMTNDQIGDSLFIAKQTVKNHITEILQALGAIDRSDAFAKGVAWGFVDPDLLPGDLVFQNFLNLSPKELQVYLLLTMPGVGLSNREIGYELITHEQRVKNLVTAILKKLDLHEREDIRRFEIKRRRHMRELDPSNLPITPQDQLMIPFIGLQVDDVTRGMAFGQKELFDWKLRVYPQVYARNSVEAVAHALFFGKFEPAFVPDEIDFAKGRLLSDEELRFLAVYRSFNPSDKPGYRARIMSLDPELFVDKITAIEEKLDVATDLQACVVGAVTQLQRPYPVGPFARQEVYKGTLLETLIRERDQQPTA